MKRWSSEPPPDGQQAHLYLNEVGIQFPRMLGEVWSERADWLERTVWRARGYSYEAGNDGVGRTKRLQLPPEHDGYFNTCREAMDWVEAGTVGLSERLGMLGNVSPEQPK